ncbi:Deoxynucleotidyltransferase terminal-interacting protein 2 [Habropoda laboriosa]|uniref:Deoxynucleotidyltransferase terminal-interacting protein 2 n=1 Tax=Habropoda laboriosa TaxID=597456 RepID=A0A0L7R599_9HYME|nr:PREDICTED: deoxynucleotidyltransferase terminal-interacting protein 2 [Habropoda laboriosa]KOC66023.1 Deoxynucleotidyltransferase terminal-interacting protein 2 [Habropoda laboriosa]
MDIIIDTRGDENLATKDHLDSDEDDINFEDNDTETPNFFDIEVDLLENEISTKKTIHNVSKDIDLEEFEKEMGWSSGRWIKNIAAPDLNPLKQKLTAVDKILKKSVITPGFEQLQAVPPYEVKKKLLQEQRRKERAKTKGKNWFNMGAPELTPEVKHDLQVIRMRSVLDPKHFYKKNDLKALPKYFQIGKVIDSPLDYYSGRLTNKERKRTIVDELMADAQFSKYNKRKYKEIIEEKKKLHHKAHRHAKKLKRGKKK